MDFWPDALPQKFIASSYSRAHPDNLIRSQMDVGPAKVRRRTSMAVSRMSGEMIMTRAQVETLRDFIDRKLGGGVFPFVFPNQERCDDLKLELSFVDSPPNAVVSVPEMARLAQMPVVSRVNNVWFRVTMDLEVLPGPTGDFNGDVTEILQVTRASKATYFDADGVLKWADENQPRLDHDPVTGEPLGLLIEPQATNLLLGSDELETQSVTVTAAQHTLSFWGTGTVALSGASTDGPLEGTGEDDRVSLTFTPSAGSLTLTVTGDVKWAQLETSPVATSYIKTEESQVTRAADNISIPLSAFPWNEAEMTAIVEFQTFELLNIPMTLHILSRQSDARFLYQVSTGNLDAYDGTNTLDFGAISTGQVVKAASSFGPRGLRGCVNGNSVVSTGYDGTFGTSPNLYLGSLNGSNGHYLHFRKLKLFPRQLSDAEMLALTV